MKVTILKNRKGKICHTIVRICMYRSKTHREYSFIQEIDLYFSDGEVRQHTIQIGENGANTLIEQILKESEEE